MSIEIQRTAELLTTRIAEKEEGGYFEDAKPLLSLLARNRERMFDSPLLLSTKAVIGLETVQTFLRAGESDEVLRAGSKVLDAIPEAYAQVRVDIFSAMESAQTTLEVSG